jgi:uncharacterized protein (DUF952 family)
VPHIYHIADQNHWELAQTSGLYVHPTLHSEGFIHCSNDTQLEVTANKYFSESDEILILYIDTGKLNAEVHHEMASRGEEFPHIYGPVNIECVAKTKKVKRRADGRYRIKV